MIARDWRPILLTCVATGIGAAFALAILRGISASIVGAEVLSSSIEGLLLGFCSGSAITLGLMLSSYWPESKRFAKYEKYFLAARHFLFGGIACGLVLSLLTVIFVGLAFHGSEMVVTANFEAGLCLAIALLPFSKEYLRHHYPRRQWVWRILLAGMLYLSLHMGFLFIKISHLSSILIWPGEAYRTGLQAKPVGAVLAWAQSFPGWYDGLALVDAFLTGAVLCASILAALWLKARTSS